MPDWEREIKQRLAELGLPPAREGEIAEELAQHVENRYEELLARGETETDASRMALAELTESDLLMRELQHVERPAAPESGITDTTSKSNIVAGFWQDLRYGWRSLLKKPGFSFVVVATLALGIGANTALFSVVNGVLLNPLPYPEPDQIVTIHQSKPNFETGAIPYPNFRDLQKENRTFTAMALSRGSEFSLIGSGDAERVTARWITTDFFSVLGVKPALGRTLAPGEDEKGANPVVLISTDLWRRKFGSAPDVLEKGITLDAKSYSIVGVIPPTPSILRNVDVYVPIGQWNNPGLGLRSVALGLHGIGRIKPGVTIGQAQADLNRVMSDLAVAYPATNKDNGSRLIGLKEGMIRDIRSILWMLLVAVGFVLLIACVNVSNLLLVRSTGRAREFAIRAALGASRSRLIRQSLMESLLLALAGGALGLLVAAVGTQAVLRVFSTTLPRADEVGLNPRVLLFTLAVSLLTGILAGLAPAIKTSQWGMSQALKEGGRGAIGGRVRAQGVFVAIEMALAFVLLVGAGLMIRSITAIWNVDPGFRPDTVLAFGLSLPPSMQHASPSAVRGSLRDLGDRLSATPDVKAVSFSSGAVPLQSEDDLFFWLDGEPKPESQSQMHMALVYRVDPGYLEVMGIQKKRGRFFTPQDDERSQPVVVIDEVFARKHFGDADPVGKRICQEGQEPQEIVGVVRHVEQWALDSSGKDELQAQLYEPFRQLRDDSLPLSFGVLVHSNTVSGKAGAALFDSIRHAVQTQNSQNVIFQPMTMNEVISGTLAERRFSMILLDAFAVVALLLASVGLYGVISYLVGQRTQELGIRIALGAQRRSVLLLVLGQGMKMALGGLALGILAAFGLTRLLETMIYGVSTTDPATFAIISILLASVALLACIIPARRATRVDPLLALRAE